MNIAIGKFGRSLFFDKEYLKTLNGDLAPMITYRILAKKYPQHKFYLICASDLYKSAKTERLRKQNDIPDNIINVFLEAKRMNSEAPIWERLVTYIKEQNITFDYGIFFQGPDFPMSIPVQGIKCLEIQKNYCAPMINVIDNFKFPYIIVNEDPRYVPICTMDLTNDESCVLSMINGKYPVQRIVSYDDINIKREHTLEYIYNGIERISLYNLKKYDFRNYKDFVIPDNRFTFAKINNHYCKKDKIFIACNYSDNKFKEVKNFVLDTFPDTIVYGKGYPEDKIKGIEKNFVNKPMSQLQDKLWNSKYTFIPSFLKNLPQFVTIKFWEMCTYGILSFVNKNGYDVDKLQPIPDFFRVESAKEFKEKIDLLENDSNLYQKYLNEIYDLLNDSYFNGKFIEDIFKPIFETKDLSLLNGESFKDNFRSII